MATAASPSPPPRRLWPARPSAVTARRAVVRNAGPGRGTDEGWGGSGRRPIRRRASTTIPALRRSWAAGATCCHVHPPHPAARAGQGGATRSGDASSTSTATARAKSLRSSVSSTRTRSAGRAPSTNTTRPPSSRASAAPPATITEGTSSRSGVTPPAWTLPDLTAANRMAARPRPAPAPGGGARPPGAAAPPPVPSGPPPAPAAELLLPQAELGLLLPLPDDRAEAVEVDAEVGLVLRAERPRGRSVARVADAERSLLRAAGHQPDDRADVGDEQDDDQPQQLGQVADLRLVGGDDVDDAVEPEGEQEKSHRTTSSQHGIPYPSPSPVAGRSDEQTR